MTKTRVDKSPRQLARLASLHKLPSRDESVSSAKSYGHVESVHSKLGSRHQSFLVRSSTTTGGKKSLGSRGSSFSFKRTNSPPEQITGWCRVISSHNGRSEQDDISSVSMSEIRTGSGNRTLNKFLRAQSAAEVLSNERVLSTHSQVSATSIFTCTIQLICFGGLCDRILASRTSAIAVLTLRQVLIPDIWELIPLQKGLFEMPPVLCWRSTGLRMTSMRRQRRMKKLWKEKSTTSWTI